MPKFAEPITNVTVPVGREATLVCIVDDLGSYKVSHINHIPYLIFRKQKKKQNNRNNICVIHRK